MLICINITCTFYVWLWRYCGAALIHMDIAVMDLLMAANHMAIPNLGIVILTRITPLHMERHIMVIHIIHTVTHGKGYPEPG